MHVTNKIDNQSKKLSKIQVQKTTKTATITKAEYERQENRKKDCEENVST